MRAGVPTAAQADGLANSAPVVSHGFRSPWPPP
jgi:hypothetical protein